MIYIDKPRQRGNKLCAHMVADTLEELHEFAAKYGLVRRYFQAARKHPHYDIWGFPLAMIEILANRGSGVMIVSDKELVLKSHLLIQKR